MSLSFPKETLPVYSHKLKNVEGRGNAESRAFFPFHRWKREDALRETCILKSIQKGQSPGPSHHPEHLKAGADLGSAYFFPEEERTRSFWIQLSLELLILLQQRPYFLSDECAQRRHFLLFDFVSDCWEQVFFFFFLFSEDPWNSSGETAGESSSLRRVCVCARARACVCTWRARWCGASVPVHLICICRALFSFLIN